MSWWLGFGGAVLLGLVAGQWADRMVVRLALGRSFFWPFRDRCAKCHGALPWGWSVPLVGYWLAGRKCPACGTRLRRRPIFLQILTASLVAGLYALYFWQVGVYFARTPLSYDNNQIIALWIYHSILATLLVAATFIDFDWLIIPDSITVTGMLIGIALGTFWYVELHPVLLFHPRPEFSTGLIPNDFFAKELGWESAPAWMENLRLAFNDHWRHHWNRWLGFLTGLVGLLVGGGTVWIVRAICSWIFRVEAIGFGDVTLMAMVGSFLGWQTSVIAFFLAPVSAVFVGIFAWIFTGNRMIPYGPHLSIASMACVFFWRPLWWYCVELFEHMGIVFFMAGAMVVILFMVASIIQAVKTLAGGLIRGAR